MNNVVPVWLRIVAVLGLLWNLFGVWAYLGTVGLVAPASSEAMAPMPAWVTAAFAISVFAGLLGCVGLLMLRRWASWLLIVSFVAVVAQDVWAFGLRAGGKEDFILPLAITLVALLLAWLGWHAAKRGWLR